MGERTEGSLGQSSRIVSFAAHHGPRLRAVEPSPISGPALRG